MTVIIILLHLNTQLQFIHNYLRGTAHIDMFAFIHKTFLNSESLAESELG